MARVHVLTQQGMNLYRCLAHFTTPAGNNAIGNTWKSAYVAAGLAQPSAMTVGTGAGQITNTENNQLTAGDLIETEFSFVYDPAFTTAQVNAALDAEATTAIATRTAELQERLRFFGYTRA